MSGDSDMSDLVRILHVFGVVNLGGAESRIMDLYRTIDRTKFQFDFMVHTTERGHYQDEIESMGGHVYNVPRFVVSNMLSYKKAWVQFFQEHTEYQVVHGHMTSTASVYLPIAKKSGVPITIAHSRNAGVDVGIKGNITHLMRHNLWKKCDYCLACSTEASYAVFGKKQSVQEKVVMLPNGIRTRNYEYQPEVANRIRGELNLVGRWIIGHVGRFHKAKNHEFLIDIFSEIKKREEKAVLILLGEGALMPKIQEKVQQLALEKDVVFLGNRTPIADYYQVMDYFVFPSFYEGMPGVVVEAQCTGLRCILSENITREVAVTNGVRYESLQTSAKEWANKVIETKDYERQSKVNELIEKGFDVESQWEVIQQIYLREQ